jgi:hypothetical protein
MQLELDHIFVCVTPGGPEGDELVRFGLREGEPNTHSGQGTACRRFPLANSMLELLWVSDAAEAQSPLAEPTQLWERWSTRASGGSPFGICLRPRAGDELHEADAALPFPGWAYRPAYLPEGLALHIGEAPVTEPMWVYLNFMSRSRRAVQFVENAAGLREITGLVLHAAAPLESAAARAMVCSGVLSVQRGERALLEIQFDGRRRRESKDFRPLLPLVFHF